MSSGPLPSSFASAAAGQTRDSKATGRNDVGRGSGSGDWPRSNGGTRTFRRSSTTPFNQITSSNPSDLSHNSVPDLSSCPTANNHAQSPEDLNYSREYLLKIYKNTEQHIDASSLFEPSWHPEVANGGHSTRTWGKSGESGHTPQDPTVCWDASGNVKPVGLEEMTPEERLMFSTDVSSTMKPPQPKQQQQEGAQGTGGVNGRKTSIGTGNYPLASPSTSRPGTRRRETVDTNPYPNDAVASPTTGRFRTNESWFPRRSTELNKETTISDEPEEDTNPRETPVKPQSIFGPIRSNTGGSTGFGGSSSLWGPGTPTSSTTIGSFGSFAMPATAEKRYPATGSRLAHLIPKESAESSTVSKPSDAASWRARQRTDTDPFAGAGDDGISGSAVLGGAQDNIPPAQVARGSIFDTPVKGSAGDFGMAGLNLGEHGNDNAPASPSETNPYRSPTAERGEEGQNDHDVDRTHQAGSTAEAQQHQQQGHQQSQQHAAYSTLPRSFGATAFEGSDRSQTSSVGAMNFHNSMGWPAPTSVGTPDRERMYNPFGNSIFGSPTVDLPSPGFGGLGGMFGVPGTSRIGRGKLGSLFPAPMQAQMHHDDHDGLGDSIPELRQHNNLGAIGRGSTIGMQSRLDTGSPIRGFDNLFPAPDPIRASFSSAEQGQPGLTSTAQAQSGFPVTAGSSFAPIESTAGPGSEKQMVMPDRMRWVYLDPQGKMQGPWSGLEMNDWYKANFFSPDLRVKKLEDRDFEPLGQLIRRIGNSREPFLVPQIGIPHGPSPTAGPYAATGNTAEAIPPLQNAFPSFGRTLTAAQQNDLERRKQEEQMYHARQREIIQSQQFNRLPMQPGIPGALHHHSSIHSLQSQPSYGSMSSTIPGLSQAPIGPIGPGAGAYFDTGMAPGPVQAPIGPAVDMFSPDLNMGERQFLAGTVPGSLQGLFPQPIIHHAETTHHNQLPAIDQLRPDELGNNERLKEFRDLRAQYDADEAASAAVAAATIAHKAAAALKPREESKEQTPVEEDDEEEEQAGASLTVTEVTVTTTETVQVPEPAVSKKQATAAQIKQEMSLTEKVRKTQADNAKSAQQQQQPAPSGLPMPFPPPQTTPLAAPTAQRPASNLPNRYGDRSASGTPDTASEGAPLGPPPTAPWAALSGAEAHKGPSLKEIQEAEAKKAAKKEEAAAAARRAALEQEAAAIREREKAAAATTTGLPTTSTWATSSPVAASAGSPWKQPAAPKTPAASNVGAKKTLAEIQREEELRKQKSQQAAVQASATAGAAFGKRYADLASKTSAPTGMSPSPAAAQASAGGGWSTVGAGGKVKIPPSGPAAQVRSASTTGIKPTPVAVVKPAPKPVTSHKDAKVHAKEELRKWIVRELSRGGTAGVDVDVAASIISDMEPNNDTVREIAYQNKTLDFDPARFINELGQRKKAADKGIVLDNDSSSTGGSESNSGSNGGWSEVAKKGGNHHQPKEEPAVPGFNIRVAKNKKNGKK